MAKFIENTIKAASVENVGKLAFLGFGVGLLGLGFSEGAGIFPCVPSLGIACYVVAVLLIVVPFPVVMLAGARLRNN